DYYCMIWHNNAYVLF
nr:immunoglobulin light chain junction region [Macaca mulatta]MOV65857.1 immunoglobulin light chain junction region [Macaca mulatta]MOV66103.1 immunoglobulin light chain junction region [Macaca mulatta]MOV66214.1 immunoglobulin light chain junction region [Macaca mulatta]MOV66362.1 immunoglobulin light chain junction region [Macaca mulatta]